MMGKLIKQKIDNPEILYPYSPPTPSYPRYQPNLNDESGIEEYKKNWINSFVKLIEDFSQKKNQIEEDKEDNIDRDFKWFTSEKAKTQQYKGQYIAIWNEQIVANASNAVEVEKQAKRIFGNDIHPLITYIPKDEITVL